MGYGRKLGLVAALLIGATTMTVACDSDEFADAPAVAASASTTDDGEAAGSDYGEAMPAQRGESAGPIQGTERPPNHPTLQGDQGEAGGSVPAPQVDRLEPSEYGESGPILWDAPAHWEARRPSNEMRFAEYGVSDGDSALSAELTVFFFGAGGGGVEDNLQRWAGQFGGDAEPERDEREVNGMTVHLIDVAGTYQTDMPMAGGDQPQEEQRLLGAIAEASAGLYFFRMVGDEELVAEQVEAFDAFVNSLEDGLS